MDDWISYMLDSRMSQSKENSPNIPVVVLQPGYYLAVDTTGFQNFPRHRLDCTSRGHALGTNPK
jgi:hypothetical protein